MTTSLATDSQAAAGPPQERPQHKPPEGFHFQVNLRAIIDLLSNHLYSGPQVFIRELLQNCVDAIRARQQTDANLKPEITIEAVPGREGRPSLLIFEDNGIGLTIDEIHTFLATIGSSSKREDLQERRVDYIGQFGIGLLSCFIVTEEIVVITRSAKANQPTLEWRGRGDGSYEIRVLDQEMAPGTKVFLRARPEREEYFEAIRVRQLARHYGALLPIPITLMESGRKAPINNQPPPWKQRHLTEASRNLHLSAHGDIRHCGVGKKLRLFYVRIRHPSGF